MSDELEVGARIRRLRLAAGLGQVEFADRLGIANGSVSKLENGQLPLSTPLLRDIGDVLDCSEAFLRASVEVAPPSRPWLRAYADAPKRTVDRQIAECMNAAEVIELLRLRTIPEALPTFSDDASNDDDIEQYALEVRAAAELDERSVVGNAMRTAERLGCILLPMPSELGRHLGMSLRADLMPFICVSRPSNDAGERVPGDRQRFTVAHELGHLGLHASLGPPQSAEQAALVEKQAHRFAGAFLAPADALLDDLDELGGRVTLRTLASLKERWGVAIKALVVRLRSLQVIDEHQARSLYKQISARGWNRNEPVPVGNETAIWLSKALQRRAPSAADPLADAADAIGIGRSHLARWTTWTSSTERSADVLTLAPRAQATTSAMTEPGTVRPLPVRRK